MNQNQFYNKLKLSGLILLFSSISLIYAKVHVPKGDESRIKLKINNKERTYFKLDKNGLNYKNIGNQVDIGDSIKIGIYSRTTKAQTGKKIRSYGFSIQIDDNKPEIIKYKKVGGNVVSKDRPGWVYTESGIWYYYLSAKKNGYKIKIKPLKGNPPGTYIRVSSNKLKKKSGALKSIKTVNSKNSWRIKTNANSSNTAKTTLWYPVSNANQQQFEIKGPATVKVFSRLKYNDSEIKKDYYLRVREDGYDLGSFYFQTEKSNESYVAKTNEPVGKWRSFWLNIPKGKHYYTFTLPENDQNKDMTVFIRIKEWLEKEK